MRASRVVVLAFSCVGILSSLAAVAVMALYWSSRNGAGLTQEDHRWLDLAYEEAARAPSHGDAPIGAVLVINGELIASGHNQVLLKRDPRNHAEVVVITEALRKLKEYAHFSRDDQVTLYTTYEPCVMCAGFIAKSRVSRIVVGESKGTLKNLRELIYPLMRNYGITDGDDGSERTEELLKKWSAENLRPQPR